MNVLGLVPDPAESEQEGRTTNEGALREVMTERETRKKMEHPRTRDMDGLTQNPSHAPGPEQDLDRRTASGTHLAQNRGPGPVKGKETKPNHHIYLSLTETK